AQSFDAVGLALDGASRHREARAAYSLAVPIWRRLGMLDHLGTTLHNIGLSYRRCGSDEDAVRHYKEAVQVRPDLLCEDDPSSHHLANLGWTLHNMTLSLSALDLRFDALQRCEETVIVRRQAAQLDLGATPELAQSLYSKGGYLSSLGREEKAVEAFSEAVNLYRMLRQNSGLGAALHNMGISLGDALHDMGLSLAACGRDQEAVSAFTEAVDLRSEASTREPEVTSHL
ncbi:hypothetical protein R3P38DRAFT_2409148, partial [Favolaschia claudopus]